MRAVSEQWKENQRQNFVTANDIKITLDVTDPEAVANATPTAGSAAYYSKINQIINDKDKTLKNYATLEQNFWCLDNTLKILPSYTPSDPLKNIGDAGYVSDILSNAQCGYTANPLITLSFSHPFTTTIPAITITWNRESGEHAVDFKITIYNGSMVIKEKEVFGNSETENIVFEDFADYDKITIELIKWCKPYSRARIADIDLGISKEFLKKEIISMSITESVDPVGASLPMNVLRFELDNSNDFFNPYNEEGFYRYLCSRQRIITKIGYYNQTTDAMEWIQMGEYFLSNWDSPQNSITATFEANNLLSFLNNKQYIECNTTASGVTLYDLAFNLLSNAGLRKNADGSNKWVICEVLKYYTTTGIIPICTYLEALQYIAQVACCVLFCDNNGNIHIEPMDYGITDYEISMFNGYQFPEIEVQKILGKVQVNCFTNKSADDTTELFSGELEVYGDETVTIAFSSPTLDSSSLQFTVTGVASYSSVNYNNACRLSLIGGSGAVTVVIRGKVAETSSRIVSVINDAYADDDQEIYNPLITNYSQAKTVGFWVKDWLTKRNQISTAWRCDPRINALDNIKIENKFETKNSVRVNSVEITYKGAFKAKMTGRLL